MKSIIIALSIGILLINPAQAEELKIGYGRLSIIDLGSLINSKPLVTNEKLVRIYEVSGLDAEHDKSIIIVQGLKSSGETDLTVDTQTGIKQFHLILDPGTTENKIVNPQSSRSIIISEAVTLEPQRSTIIEMPAHINEYVLGGNPNLISIKQIKDYHDKDFLKTFALNTNASEGLTDIAIATRKAVYKLTLDIRRINNEHIQHHSLIDLRNKLSTSI